MNLLTETQNVDVYGNFKSLALVALIPNEQRDAARLFTVHEKLSGAYDQCFRNLRVSERYALDARGQAAAVGQRRRGIAAKRVDLLRVQVARQGIVSSGEQCPAAQIEVEALRRRAAAQDVVRNVDREIADLEASIADGSFVA